MRRNKCSYVIMFLLTIVLVWGCVPGQESFKMGQELSNQNRGEEAILFYERALQENPDKEEFEIALKKAKQESAKARFANAKEIMGSNPDPNVPALDSILKELERARQFDPENKEVSATYTDLWGKRKNLLVKIKILYKKADTYIRKQEWFEAIVTLKLINVFYPGYEDAGDKFALAKKEGTNFYYKQGISHNKKEEWPKAVQAFKLVLNIDPKYKDIQALYKEVKVNDNPQAYLNRAEEAAGDGNYERGIYLLTKGMEYYPDNEVISRSLESVRLKAGHHYLNQASEFFWKNILNQAVLRLQTVMRYAPSLKKDDQYDEFLNRLSQQLLDRSKDYMGRKKWGNALVWLEKLEAINPDFGNLFYEKRAIEDAIKKRIRRSIAVFDFSSPKNNEDAGKIIAKKLITFLFEKSSDDVKIIEREHLQTILEEYKLGQTGLIDIERAKQAGKMKGIDIFILGDVLHFSSSIKDFPSTKTVMIKVGSKRVKTTAFLEWEAKHPNPTRKELEAAPRAYEEQPVYERFSYKAGVAKILAFLEISYKMVDTLTSENLFTSTKSGKLRKEDTYNDGPPKEANIKFDPLDLPTELEVLDELTNIKVTEFGLSILKHFQNLEVVYFNEAELLLRRREYEQAIEKYTDTIYDEKLKSISTPISKKASEKIQNLVQDI